MDLAVVFLHRLEFFFMKAESNFNLVGILNTYVYQKMAFWKSVKINVSWIVYLGLQDWEKVQILKDFLHFHPMLLLLKHD